MPSQKQTNTTAVLVHAAWADGSSWNKATLNSRVMGLTWWRRRLFGRSISLG